MIKLNKFWHKNHFLNLLKLAEKKIILRIKKIYQYYLSFIMYFLIKNIEIYSNYIFILNTQENKIKKDIII